MRVRNLAVPALALSLVVTAPTLATAAPSEEFPGFTSVDSYAQGQAGTGYLFLVGDEENRLFGAQAVLNGPPAGSQAVAAFFQRGVAAQYTYGVAGGGSAGKNGVLPEPPPGEAAAYFPAEPREFTFEGPLSTATGSAADSRFYAKATDTPSAQSDAAATNFDAAGQFAFEHVHVASHTEPVEGGVLAESTSTILNLVIGPLQIQHLASHAVGTITAQGKPTGSAQTVAYGATVNGIGVEITDSGVVVAGTPAPGSQQEVNAALAQAGLGSITLVPSSVGAGEVGDVSINAVTSGLRVVYKDEALGAANPQGFAGGGFAFGGAEVRLLGNLSSSYSPVDTADTVDSVDSVDTVDTITSDATSSLGASRPTMTDFRPDVRSSATPVRAARPEVDLTELTLATANLTPKDASRVEKGYLAFGAALLVMAAVVAWPAVVRIRSRR